MKTTGYEELDFYVQYLRNHLTEHRFDKENNKKFIEARADKALDTYLSEFMSGKPPYVCHETAMRTLLEGIYVSRFDVLYRILEEDCWLRMPPEAWEPTALHLQALPEIKSILDRHEVNGDFLAKEDFPGLRYELLGAITEILDSYGL